MRKAKIGRKVLTLRDEDWETLEKRFNIENVEKLGEDAERDYCIDKKCLCDKYDDDCDKCPFSKVATDKPLFLYGCLDVVDKILGDHTEDMKLFSETVEWYDLYDEEAREQVEKIHSFLINMEKC